MATSDSQRMENEDRLCERVMRAQIALDMALVERNRENKIKAARDLKKAIDELLDYVMRDILPPDLQTQ